jgi:tetratricopeptide (TPR) repeat protein
VAQRRASTKLNDTVDRLLLKNQHAKAEEILLNAYNDAKEDSNSQKLDSILGHLVFVYSSSDPPNVSKAERFCFERERNQDTSYNKLQTAKTLYYLYGDYPRAMAKLREAINTGKTEDDQRTVYSSLSLLGQALLELNRTDEVSEVLGEIERMLLDKKPFVVGDETPFLVLV